MTRGVYAAAGAMTVQLLKQDLLANNLANASSVGFKRDRLAFESVTVPPPEALRSRGPAFGLANTVTSFAARTDFSGGPERTTGNPLDLALPPGAFLTVDTPAGPRYTRNGNLRVSESGQLETGEGFAVRGSGGPVQLPRESARLNTRGEIEVKGQVVDRLALARFTDPRVLRKEGNGLFSASPTAAAPEPVDRDARVHVGSLEGSNVSPVHTLVEMLATLRAYEATQKSLQLQDESLARMMEVMR